MLDLAPAKSELCLQLQSCLSGSIVRANEPLASRTTLRVGGPAEMYLEPVSERDLAAALQFCHCRKVPYFVLGRGSNLLIRQSGIRGVVICLAHSVFCRLETRLTEFYCGAGAKLNTVSAQARKLGWTGLEFLEGIPGSVGGALRMNAGAMGSSTFDVVKTVRLMDPCGQIEERSPAQLPVSYRSCALLKTHIALGATFCGRPASQEYIAERSRLFNEKRWLSQPKESSAGCIFKNPSPSVAAGKVIDQAGLKGLRVGGASVSRLHGNFIINDGGATAADILKLIQLVRTLVKERSGIELETEVEIIGED